jgi:hypothetical protein
VPRSAPAWCRRRSRSPPRRRCSERSRSQKRGIEPQLAAALVQIDDYAFLLTWAVDAVMIGAVAAVALRTAVLPRWLGIAGAVIAPLLLASLAGGEGAPPVFLLALLWFVAVSVTLAGGANPASRGRTAASSAAPAAS